MTHTKILLLAIAWILGGPIISSAQENSDIVGAWRGALDYDRPDGDTQKIYFGLGVSEEAGEISGSAFAYQIGLDATISAISVEDGQATIEFPFLDGNGVLSASLTGNTLEGVLTSEQGARPVVLEKVFRDVEREYLKSKAGLYELENGEQLVLAARSWLFSVYNLNTWEYRNYYPSNATTFIAGAGARLPAPHETKISFTAEEAINQMRFQSRSGKELTGSKSTTIVQEEISFQNGETTLAGYLIRPAQATGALPGVVVVWGSGRQDRFGFDGLPYLRAIWLAQKGFATIVYDKRGVGASTGSYDERTNEEMAGDMAAAVDYLAARPEIDATRVGLFVHSQSGIYAPLTMKMTDNVSFAVVLAATVVNSEIQEIVRTEQMLMADGWPQESVTAAVGTQILKFYYARERIGWDAYVAAYHRVKDEPWFESVIGSHIDQERSVWDFWKDINSYEPAENWVDIEIPVLFLIGETDTINPVEANLTAIRAAFAKERSELLTVKKYKNAEHALFRTKNGGLLEEASTTHLTPYLDDVFAWLDKRGFAP